MARAGDVLENPATGDRLVFLRTASETGGEVLEYELEFVPRGFAVRNHLHPLQEERHEVLEGTLGIVVAGWQRRLGPGDVGPGTHDGKQRHAGQCCFCSKMHVMRAP